MSTAMNLIHTRNQNFDMAQGAQQVQHRTAHLIQLSQLALVQANIHRLLASIKTGTGDYQGFLERGAYDDEQKQAIAQTLQSVIT